ncbi:ATP-binding protein [Nitrosomonas sp.]|uniref:AAA family ATPase n=1 Tax=Nitrosomonas sp. TaxID=42353 RepID=UPI0025FC90F6|nr:ATP-binding protein [Nitrosomonas sp.]MBV6446602.1 ATP-dependent zinc metalloprotease FtsH [Nitrosomonas sp.]MCC6923982.1 ATP-binding protein [Nitrosomonas sp.]
MATSDQIKALLKSHAEGDDRRFYSIARQIAAQAAQKGHGKMAQEIKEMLDAIVDKPANYVHIDRPNTIPLAQPKGELGGLISVEYSNLKLDDLILPKEVEDRLRRVTLEHRQKSKLQEHGLHPRSKILLVGPPGTGKTMTAKALAGEMHLPIFSIQLDRLLTKYLGETAAKLRLIFDNVKQTRGIYFFDEFDAIGGKRDIGNDIGEVRRVLNSFLQFIEEAGSESLVLAATNHPEILDQALFRRFDDVIFYEMPDKELILKTFKVNLKSKNIKDISWNKVVDAAATLSYAEITRVCEDTLKTLILEDRTSLSTQLLIDIITQRIKTKS